MPCHIFISYSRADIVYAGDLSYILERMGFQVWMDRQLEYGQQWPKVPSDRIDDCGLFVPIMSRTAEASEWVGREIERATGQGKRIMPLLLDGDGIPALHEYQFADVRNGAKPPEAWFRLVRALRCVEMRLRFAVGVNAEGGWGAIECRGAGSRRVPRGARALCHGPAP